MDLELPAWYSRFLWQEWDMGEIYDRLCPSKPCYTYDLEVCKAYMAYWNHNALYKASIVNTWQIAFNLSLHKVPYTILIWAPYDDTYLQVRFSSGTVYLKATIRPTSKHEVYIGFVNHLHISDYGILQTCAGIRFEDGCHLDKGKRDFERSTKG